MFGVLPGGRRVVRRAGHLAGWALWRLARRLAPESARLPTSLVAGAAGPCGSAQGRRAPGQPARRQRSFPPPPLFSPRVIEEERSDLAAGVIRSLLWLAAFCFAAGIFLTATLLLRGVPTTPHVAVGRVTVENASKL